MPAVQVLCIEYTELSNKIFYYNIYIKYIYMKHIFISQSTVFTIE